jgi:hypothetical protein
MWLGEDVSYFCENCKDEAMFHFEDFPKMLDRNKLREASEPDHHLRFGISDLGFLICP